MLEIFKKLRAGPVSATALRDALGALDPDAVTRTVAKREDARREAILSGETKAIAAAEAALVEARLEAERVEIARKELAARLAEAEAREADAAVAVRIREIESRRDAVRHRVERELAPALTIACDILGEIAAIDSEVAAENARLSANGRPERVASVEDGFTPIPAGQHADIWRLSRTITIRPISAWGVAGWNWAQWNPDT